MIILEPLAAADRKPFSTADHSIVCQVGILAGEQLDHIHPKLLGAAVKKRKGKILSTGFQDLVLFHADARRHSPSLPMKTP